MIVPCSAPFAVTPRITIGRVLELFSEPFSGKYTTYLPVAAQLYVQISKHIDQYLFT